MKKNILLFITSGILCLSLCACGSSNSNNNENTETSQVSNTPAAESAVDETTVAENPVEERSITEVAIGQTIETDKFKMSVDSMEIVDEYKYPTSEHSSHSIYVEEGYKALIIKGNFENKGTSVISNSSFYLEALINNEYAVSGFDVRLEFERDKYFEIDPYTDQQYYLYVCIPEKLAAQFKTATFTLGFKNDMSLLTTTYNMDGTTSVDADNWFSITK